MIQSLWRFMYAWIAVPIITIVVHLLALKNHNLREGLEGRKGLWQRLEMQLADRDPEKPLIWFHVASAGEFLQAQPVFERFLRDGYECAITFTSVNGYKWIQRTPFPEGQTPLVREYLPLDSARNMRRLLKILQPSAIVYVKYDLWPNLVWEARDAGIPQYLISAILQPQSARLASAPGRSLYRSLYACLDGIFAVTEEDRQRFVSTNPDHPNIQTVGSTGFDIVLARKRKIAPPKLPMSFHKKFVFIAGSSWPPDEACIFPALKEALEQYPDLRIIIAPHEPTEDYLKRSEMFFHEYPLERLTSFQKKTETAQHTPRIILVDTIGVLSALYSAGTLAYVGGAFTTGVHNVIEPCAMGMPVIFGPRHDNAPEALDFVKRGVAFPINTSQEFRTRLLHFLNNPEECKQLGHRAIQTIEAQAGVAARCFDLIKTRIMQA